MMLYKIALFIYCFILILDMHKAKDIKNILERGFISVVMMIAMLIATIAK
nr:MAG TPA: transmembrane protein [Caudoviricetes sp.]